MRLFRSLPLALASALGCVLLLSSAPALACKCMLPEIAEARDDASALFEGRVVSLERQEDPNSITDRRVTLAVVRSWKALHDVERVDVYTNSSTAACGYPFEENTSYLVYARESEGRLHVSLCSRTRPVAEAEKDLVVLGAGATPVHIEPKRRGGGQTRAGDGPAQPDVGAIVAARPGVQGAADKGATQPSQPPPKEPSGPGATPTAAAEKKRGCSLSSPAQGSRGAADGVLVLVSLALLGLRRRRS